MPKIDILDTKGNVVGNTELSERVFGIEPNEPVVHQVVVAQLANKRQGTKGSKTRSEVRGGGRKPWRQKGTGRARAGSSRSPLWIGGGVIFAPKSRDYSKKVNKKVNDMIELVELTADDYYKNVSLGNAFNVLVPAAYDAATTVKSGISKAIVPCVGAEALIFIFYIGYSFVAGLVDGTKKKRAEKEAAAQAAAAGAAGAAGGGDEPKDAPASDAETKDEPADETDKS